MKIYFVLLLWPLLFSLVTSKPVDNDHKVDELINNDSSELGVTTTEESTSTTSSLATTIGTTPVPKIQLNALLSAVQHTIVHSAQNLVNITKLNSTDGNTIISVPITLASTSTTQKPNTTNDEQIKEQIENNKPNDEKNTKLPTTTNTTATNQQNITIPLTATSQLSNVTNSENVTTSSIIHTEEKITLFSPGSVIFPSIPAILAEDYKPINNTKSLDNSSSSESSSSESISDHNSNNKDEDDCTKENSSSESTEKCEQHKMLAKKTATQVKKANILKEKIAEIEAEPVILTQGI